MSFGDLIHAHTEKCTKVPREHGERATVYLFKRMVQNKLRGSCALIILSQKDAQSTDVFKVYNAVFKSSMTSTNKH